MHRLARPLSRMAGPGVAMVNQLIPGTKLPLDREAPFYVLVELATARNDGGLLDHLEGVLAAAFEQGTVTDAVVASTQAQRLAIWKLREEQSEAQKRAGASVKNDVSVPVSKVPLFIERATAACEKLIPGIRVLPFGHMGDGNIHFNLVQLDGVEADTFLAHSHEIMHVVGEIVRNLEGSFSAEHGVGKLKAHMMTGWRGGCELDAMRRMKTAFDPRGIMNPGKLAIESNN